jgi:hypothetical protein
MTEGQKIAIGYPGLTSPEMYIPGPRGGQKSSANIASDHDSTKAVRRGGGRGARIIRSLRFIVACLAIGSRTVALADNSQLRRDLSARARLLYGLDED